MKFSEYLIQERFSTAFKREGVFRGDPKEYIEIYENPTESEIKELAKDFKKLNPQLDLGDVYAGTIRGMFDKKGNMYVWISNTLHHEVINHLKKEGKETDILRFIYDLHTEDNDSINAYNNKWLKEAKKYLKIEQIMKRLQTAFPKVKSIGFSS